MARSSKEQTRKHREQIVETASHLFRERGLDGVSVPELMGAAGLTHGGFYGHFASKDALAALAIEEGFGEFKDYMEAIVAEHPDDLATARSQILGNYLSIPHRDNPSMGCTTAALSIDASRVSPENPVRASYLKGVRDLVDGLARLSPEPDTEGTARDEALSTLALLVGTLLLSRATRGDAISDEFMAASRSRLLE
jgi:TetR/AcrR family transcriptional repressor of nem operon